MNKFFVFFISICSLVIGTYLGVLITSKEKNQDSFNNGRIHMLQDLYEVIRSEFPHKIKWKPETEGSNTYVSNIPVTSELFQVKECTVYIIEKNGMKSLGYTE